GAVYVEDPNAASGAGAFFDTKDFCFGTPAVRADIEAIKVEWECLSNATTNAIRVYALSRDDLLPGILGSDGLQQDLTSLFVLQGTLTGGTARLPVRLRGKYVRFRFQQVSGRMRIRSFAVAWQPTTSDT